MSESEQNFIPEKNKEKKATDQEVADFFIFHIDNPCQVELFDGQKTNIRDFYIREALRILPKMTDSESIRKLQEKIQKYR